MIQPDVKLATLPTLPLPYYDQRVVVQLYKAAAVKCRTQHKDWILHPKETVADYVKALGRERPEWRIMRYSHKVDDELHEVFRCQVTLPLQPTVTIYGDALLAKRADMTAALHAILYLLSKDIITQDGLPTLPPSPPRSSSDSESASSGASSSSGAGPAEGLSRSFTSVQASRTSILQSVIQHPMTDVYNSRERQAPPATSSSSVSDTQEQIPRPPSPSSSTSSHPDPAQNLNASSSRAVAHMIERGSSADRVDETFYPSSNGIFRDSSIVPRSDSPAPLRRNEPMAHTMSSPSASSTSSTSSKHLPSVPQTSTSPHHLVYPPMGLPTGPTSVQAASVSIPQPQSGAPARHQISLELARGFIDFYCSKYGFGRPDIRYNKLNKATTALEAYMYIAGNRCGTGSGCNMKEATSLCYIDACMWMSSCDDTLWYQYLMADANKKAGEAKSTQMKNQQKQDYVPSVQLAFSDKLDAKLRNVIWEARKSELHRKALSSRAKADAEVRRFKEQREKTAANLATKGGKPQINSASSGYPNSNTYIDPMKADALAYKSRDLQDRQDRYRSDPRQSKMRETRASLPISEHAQRLIQAIEEHPVLVVMAQTGSGKTTQLPQIILDHCIEQGKGASCNIICTQPRRLAAISVAQRVATERGEPPGRTVGYQVRFENSFPERDGSILFMTSGIFLKRMQVGLEDLNSGKSSFLDEVSHVIVDEVHERDIDVDLLLFILKRQLEERRKTGKPEFKVILMSATIDPSLFRNYFPDPVKRKPAPYLEIPGRTYPVKKYHLNKIYASLQQHHLYPQFRWVFEEKEVKPYMTREMQNPLDRSAASRTDDDLKFPALLVALVVAFVAQRTAKTRDGHILVFLPGLEEIKAVQRALVDANRPLLNVDFSNYEMHILHSEVPVAEQQLVFSPAPPGLQRIILSTNIAETSVTIPDVVYVVDAGKCKEKRFDPERHLSSLVQAFTGLGNMGQRAGRAGRHRPGEYFSLVTESRLACLPQNQTVEMKRSDLSNVVMHVKGFNLPMEVEDVLDECIEPPGRERVVAAIRTLERVGALDSNKNLTSLGKVLLHLPVEAAIGKLCLLGCFFRCLDQVLVIAALLTNRDPFVAPIDKRFEANMAKKRFCPPGFVSDTLTALKAYNEWASLPSFFEQRRFCEDNFLSHGGLRTIEKLRTSLIQSLDRAGVLSLAGGGDRLELQKNRDGVPVLPYFLNTNGENLPLLAALISCATAPGFAVRKGPTLLRTPQDTTATLHASSIVTIMKKTLPSTNGYAKDIFAYMEAVKNVSKGGAGQTNGLKMNSQLRGVTLLDPLGLLLFGVHKLEINRDGFLCDGWLPLAGKVDMLDDLERFKDVLHASLLRAFEGLGAAMLARTKSSFSRNGRVGEYTATDEYEDAPEEDGTIGPLSDQELEDLDRLANSVVEVLQQHAMDNELPAKYDLARIYSSEDDYIARHYPVRVSHGSNRGKVAKKDKPSYGEWDAWGGLVPTQVTTSVAPPRGHVEDTSVTEAEKSRSPATERGVNQGATREDSVAPEKDDWGTWRPTTDNNDAFERRAALRRPSSTTSSTYTVPRPRTPVASVNSTTGIVNQSNLEAKLTQKLSPLPKVKGWIGAENFQALRSSGQDGWRSLEDRSPAAIMPKSGSGARDTASSTPARQPAILADVPTRSGPPESEGGKSAVWTSGWQQYDRYNPRTHSNQKSGGRPLAPNAGFSPSASQKSPPTSTEDVYPILPSSISSVPFHRKEPQKTTTGATSWDDWQPTRARDGEEAYRSRAGKTARAHVVPVPLPHEVAPANALPNPAARSDPPQADYTLVEASRITASTDVGRVETPRMPERTSEGWDSWKPAQAPESEGAQNYQRRAAMARGQLAAEPTRGPAATSTAPMSFATDANNVAPTEVKANQPSQPQQADDDPWSRYTPAVSAEQQGNEAFRRRQAMSGQLHESGFSNTSGTSSFSSTSSSGMPAYLPKSLNTQKTMSIAGRAQREAEEQAARQAKLAAFNNSADGMSDLAKNMMSLKIAGAARAGANTSFSANASKENAANVSAPSKTTQAPLTRLASNTSGPNLDAYSVPLRQPQGLTGDMDTFSRGFNHSRTNPLNVHSAASVAASSDSGTFISGRPNGQLNGKQVRVIGHTNADGAAVPHGGIGWD